MWQRVVFLSSRCPTILIPKNVQSVRSRQFASLSPAFCRSAANTGAVLSEWQTERLSPLLNSLSLETNFVRRIHLSFVFGQEVRTVKTPQFADSISEGDVRWHKAVGDQVKEDDVIGEIETDKTSIPLPAPASGVISELLFGDGDKVTAGAELYKLQLGASGEKFAKKDDAATETQKQSSSDESKEPPAKERAQQGRSASDQQPEVASKQKEQSGRSQSDSDTSGPIPSQLPKIPPLPKEPMSSRAVSSAPVTPKDSKTDKSDAPTGQRTESRVKMNKMRQRISERLKESQNTAAMLTTFNEVDMSTIIEMRNKYKDHFLKVHNVKLGFMSPFVKAAAYALKDQPIVNAVIDGKEILYRDYIDISVAVASPKGLVVPVLRNVESMSYAGIEKGIMELGKKAQDGSLAIEDMTGGTFTISNGGVFGSLMGTPIINPPQSAILGMHATFDRPVAINGKVEIRPMMYVALTYDHRLIDGREAVTFLKKIKSAVEDPRTLLLEL